MTEKRKEFLKSLGNENVTDGNRVFAAMNTSARTREEYAKAREEEKKTKEFIQSIKLSNADSIFAAINMSSRARERVAKAKIAITDSKESLR